jgi:predicted ATP-grasp superfamily ATP-dependent carboligase
LAVARSLGRRGVPVWFVTDDHPIAKYSRYVERSFDWRGPDDPNATGWLVGLARRHALEDWTLFAGGDREVRLVAENHELLARAFRLTTPPWAVAQFACDKRLTHQHAVAVGVDCPWSLYPACRADVAAAALRFPVILKPTHRTGRNAFTDAKAWRVDDRAALLSRYDEAAALVGPDAIVIQELIPGAGDVQFSYAAVWDNGAPVASMIARRLRQYPVDFGFTSTFVETFEHAPVEEAANRFLAALGFSGLVEVEFKYDVRDCRYKLLDVNPRAWTWIGLSEAAGVDLPWIQWRLSRGETALEAAPAPRARTGLAWTHASRDLVAAAQQIARGALRPRDYAASLARSARFAAFAMDDPAPALVDLPIVIARLLTRRFTNAPRSAAAVQPFGPAAREGFVASGDCGPVATSPCSAPIVENVVE